LRVTLLLLILFSASWAMPGMPPELYDYYGLTPPVTFAEPERPDGVDQPSPVPPAANLTVRPLVLLVDFDDQPADKDIHPPLEYGKIIFRRNQEPGTFSDYWNEVTGSRVRIVGDEESDVDSAWIRVSGTYDPTGEDLDYGFFTDGQYGFGDYPRNSQGMVYHALVAADPRINFADYDNDGPDGIPRSADPEHSDDDGYVDALFVVHAGWGAEQSRDRGNIWSCKWDLESNGGPGAFSTDDGVKIKGFMVVPEELLDNADDGNELLVTIGVFCHDFGYMLGLPALYDTTPHRWDADSYGIGYWGLMGYGAWTGIVAYPQRVPLPGNCPVHPMAWSKYYAGWVSVTNATQGRNQPHAIYRAESSAPPDATRFLRITVAGPEEYFLLENRQQVGFDRGLAYLEHIEPDDPTPCDGLLIWHIDERVIEDNLSDNTVNGNKLHKGVDLEEADGYNDLDFRVNLGDDGDPFPGHFSKREFGPDTSPDSLPYGSAESTCYIERISDSGNPMTLYVTSIRNPLTRGVMAGPNPYYPARDDHLTFFFEFGIRVTVRIYTLSGDLVRTIGEDEVDEAFGQAAWYGDNDDGSQVATGLYFFTVDSGDYHVGHGKFTVIR
jgi:immune inhibitor A